MKSGLVLEGGGTRGIYTAGILDVFLEYGIEFDGVIGVSAGAIHGVSFVSKQKGRSIRYYKKYCNDPRFMGVRSWIKTGEVLKHRYISYNESMKYIERLEKEGKVLVIRPKKALDIGRLENNPEKTQEIYDVGYQDGLKMIEKVKAFLDAK